MKTLNFIYLITVLLISASCQKETIDTIDTVEAAEEKSTDLKMGFTASKKVLKTTKFDTKESLLPRYNHRSLAFKDKMWILGGNLINADNTGFYTSNDVMFSTDGAQWKTVTEKANFPEKSLFGATVFKNKIWIAGGLVTNPNPIAKTSNDVWSSEDGIEWKLVTPNAQFHKRINHTLSAFNGFLWLIGGAAYNEKTDMYETLSDIWRSSDGMNWVQVTGSAPFGPCRDFGAVVHDNKLWVVGGGESFGLKDVWYTENGYQWAKATDTLPFSTRTLYTVESTGKLMWLIAGYTGFNGQQNDLWYSSNGADWFQAKTTQEFPVRAQHSSVFFDDKLWVINGAGPNDGSGINPILSDVWAFEHQSLDKSKDP